MLRAGIEPNFMRRFLLNRIKFPPVLSPENVSDGRHKASEVLVPPPYIYCLPMLMDGIEPFPVGRLILHLYQRKLT